MVNSEGYMREVKGKRGHKRIIYSKAEEKYYKENKRKIIDGLTGLGVKKNQVKRIFFKNVREEMNVNNVSESRAMRKVLNSRTFTSKEEHYESYKEDVIGKMIKGQKRRIKEYLGINQKSKLDYENWTSTDDGWKFANSNGKIILISKNGNSLEYDLIFA